MLDDLMLGAYREELPYVAQELENANAESPLRIAMGAHERIQRRFTIYGETINAHGVPECHKGCSYCCHMKTEVLASEAILIAWYLKESLPDSQFLRMREKVAQAALRFRGLRATERATARLPCPLLHEESGTCTVYDERPLTCRSYASLSRAACGKFFDTLALDAIPVNPIILGLGEATNKGQSDGLTKAFRDGRVFELANALHVALTEPNAAERWANGEMVFDAAELPSDESDRQGFRAIQDTRMKMGDAAALSHATRVFQGTGLSKSKNQRKRDRRSRRQSHGN
ncbi:MAG: YkgJ family cysteine cluster protein [Polyangiaceae bacterium]|nr:YkgJ family cysteine cluster protein [Polyangiaceae bacterium]